MTLHIGWWAIPAVISAISLGSVLLPDPAPRGYGDLGNGILGMFHLLVAVIVSLLAWLIWALAA